VKEETVMLVNIIIVQNYNWKKECNRVI
jgi:hypothetical protein